jgi:hypothetical protein
MIVTPVQLSAFHGCALKCTRFEAASPARTGRNTNKLVDTEPKIRKVAFLGDYLPRQCGIATFASNLLKSVAAAHLQSHCFGVPVNDIESGYEYPLRDDRLRHNRCHGAARRSIGRDAIVIFLARLTWKSPS